MKQAMFLALATVFLSSALAQSPPAQPPPTQPVSAAACSSNPGQYWQPLFQFPESPEQAESGQLWKVDYQELVGKGRLTADQASFLVKGSPKASESQGKLVEGYVIAYNSCTQQLYVDYKEAEALSPTIDQGQIVQAALNVAAADTAQQQQAVAPAGAMSQGMGPSTGSQIGHSVAGIAGFANPLAFAVAPVAGFIGDRLGKLFSRGSGDYVKVPGAGRFSPTGVKMSFGDSYAKAYQY